MLPSESQSTQRHEENHDIDVAAETTQGDIVYKEINHAK